MQLFFWFGALIRKAKVLAVHRQTSVSGMLSAELRDIVQKAEKYEAAGRSAVDNLRKGLHLGGNRMGDREALHER